MLTGRPARRAWYLLVVPVLLAVGLYLVGCSTGGASPPAPGTAIAPETTGACRSARSCAASPIHVGLARVPASARVGHLAARPSPPGHLAARGPSAAASGSASARPGPSASQEGTSQQGTPADQVLALNILSTTFTHIGIAVYQDSSGTVWLTQDFSN